MNSRIFKSFIGLLAIGLPLAGACFAQDAPVNVFDTINNTMAYHKGIAQLQENRDAVMHEVERAKAGYYFRVDLDGELGLGTISNTTTRFTGRDSDLYPNGNISLTLTQPLWDGMANRSRVRGAEATLRSMDHRIFDNANTLALDALISHMDVIRHRKIYQLSLQNVARHQTLLAQTRDRAFGGIDDMSDISQAQSRLARAQATLSENWATLQSAEELYYRLTNTRPSANLVEVSLPPVLYRDAISIMDDALEHNPKLLAYYEDINVTRADEELAWAAFHPLINFQMGPSYESHGATPDSWVFSYDMKATIQWNLYNSGADVAETQAAAARVRQARQFVLDFLDDLAQEIENTWVAYNSAQEQATHYNTAINSNITTRNAYQEQFILGSRSLLDVLDVESELFNSQTQHLTAQNNIIISTYRMLALSGVMLDVLNVDYSGLDSVPEPLYQFDEEIVYHDEFWVVRGNRLFGNIDE